MVQKTDDTTARLESALEQTCWSVLRGDRDGALVLDLGERMRRPVRLSNPTLSFVQRTYEGEYSFLLECPWRLDGPEGVLTSSEIPEPRELEEARGQLSRLEGRSLEGVEVTSAGADLRLEFEGGLVLRAFPVATAKQKTSWTFVSPRERVIVGARGRVDVESRKTLERRLASLRAALRGEKEDAVLRFLRERGEDPDAPGDEDEVEDRPSQSRTLIPMTPRGARVLPTRAKKKAPASKKKRGKKPRSR